MTKRYLRRSYLKRKLAVGFNYGVESVKWEKLSILVLCHNQLQYTQKFFDSLYKFTNNFEVLVLDNASTDGTLEWLQKFSQDHKEVMVFHSDKNLGYIGGNNLLISKAKGDYIAVVNNDVEFRDRWVESLIYELQHNLRIAQVGSHSENGFLRPDGIGTGRAGQVGEQEYIEGWLFIIPRWVYDKFGLFDDKNLKFCYGEDSDFSLRLREVGYKIKTISLNVVHFGQATSKNIPEYDHELRKGFFENHQYLKVRWAEYLEKRQFISKVLFIRAGGLGDVLLATPVVRAVKRKFPKAKISFATSVPEVLQGNLNIDEVVSMYGLQPNNYDLVVDLYYERTPKIHIVQAYLEQAGVESNDWSLDFQLKPEDVKFAAEKFGSGQWVVIHTGKTWVSREWSIDKWQQLVYQLQVEGYNIAEVGRGDTVRLEGISYSACGRVTVGQMAGLISQAKLFVGIDSLPAHIAQAVGTKSVVLYGAVDPKLRVVNSKLQTSVFADIECRGCHHRLKPPVFHSVCKDGTADCMQRLETEQVFEACCKSLGEKEVICDGRY